MVCVPGAAPSCCPPPEQSTSLLIKGKIWGETKLPLQGNFATEHEVGVSVDFSPDILRETIISLKENSSLCDKLGRNGHKLAIETYNWEKQAENLINLYHSIS